MKEFFAGLYIRFTELPFAARITVVAVITALLVSAVSLALLFSGGDDGYYADAGIELPLPPPPIPTPFPTPAPTPEPVEDEPDEEEIYDPGPLSILTGLPLEEEYIFRRPVAVVINNIRRALPQSGIASADIIYEVLAEGDVTRFVAVFQSYIPDKIGPVRSARDYFVDFAFNHDAIFVHHGGSETGYARVRNTRINALDGMNLEGRVFWRDRTYPYWSFNTGTRPLEHSSYTGWSRIYPHLESADIRGYIGEGPEFGFNFGEIPDEIESLGAANHITVPFVRTNARLFVFDPETGLYFVENRDGAHVDAENREQAAVANVLVQFAQMRVVDNIGRHNVTTVGEGSGYLMRGGEYFAVRWEKESHTEPMRWYFENGEPVVLAPGRTWICVFQGEVEIE